MSASLLTTVANNASGWVMARKRGSISQPAKRIDMCQMENYAHRETVGHRNPIPNDFVESYEIRRIRCDVMKQVSIRQSIVFKWMYWRYRS